LVLNTESHETGKIYSNALVRASRTRY